MSYFIDTHCHLDSLTTEISEVLEACKINDIQKVITIGAADICESAHRAIKLAKKYSNVFCSVGIHPHDAGKGSLEEIEELISHPKVVAIGETGLDYFRDWSPFEKQRDYFKRSIELALKFNKPLIIHCRDAREECLEILIAEGASKVGGVFHCFSETAEFAKEILNINFIISLTGIITFKKAEALRQEIEKIPMETIMLETDSPYMAPEPFRGKECSPSLLVHTAKKLAEIKCLTTDEIMAITTTNALKLFKLLKN